VTIDLPKLMDLQAVAAVCHVSPHTVRKWVRQGKLMPLRICRRLLFHPDELNRFLADAR
jgi:predicted site-specific integrase-resolvase